MSHFTVGVILPKINHEDMEGVIAELLAPYDENTEVESYEQSCYCVNSAARSHGRNMANKLVGTWDERKVLFRSQPGIPELDEQRKRAYRAKDWETVKALDEELNTRWREYMKPFQQDHDETADAHAQSHPLYMKPRPDCEDCNGTGKVMSTYNPKQYRIDFCPGLSYNPLSERISNDGKRQETNQPTGNEVLRPMWSDETVIRLSESNTFSRRRIHLLFPLHQGSQQGTASRIEKVMDTDREVRHNAGRIHEDAQSTEGTLRDLRETGESNKGELVGGGSRSQDWESARAFMRSMQYSTGIIGGELSCYQCNEKIPHAPHVTGKTLIGGSQWDWYRVGGRWDGRLIGNPQDSENGFNFDSKHETIANNSLPLNELLQRYEKTGELFTFFALVTPKGEWIEKGDMGWWGIVMDEKQPEDWQEQSLRIYSLYAGHDIVLLDCHI